MIINDERGNPQRVPLMSLMIGVVVSDEGPFYDTEELRRAVDAASRGYPSFSLERRKLIEGIVGQPKLSLLALTVESDSRDAQELFQTGELIVSHARYVIPIGRADVAVIIPTAVVDMSVEQLLNEGSCPASVQDVVAWLHD